MRVTSDPGVHSGTHPCPMRTTILSLVLLLPWTLACDGGGPMRLRPAAPVEVVPAATERTVPLAHLVDSLRCDPTTVRFHVDKSERAFRVYAMPRGGGEELRLKEYPCVLGEAPVGDKFMQGDRRTPEGTFTFRGKREHAQWHKFIWVDYPNAESWRRFKERQAAGLIPAGKDIGGEIGIHGVPDGMDAWIEQGADWTWGCIALRNADVDEIYPYVRPQRTMITIEP